MKWPIWLLAAFLLAGCSRPAAVPAGSDAINGAGVSQVGYLQVVVLSGEQGQNPPLAGAEVFIRELGVTQTTDSAGATPPIRVALPAMHPTVPGWQAGYYTIIVSKPGFKRFIHTTMIGGKSTAGEPITTYAYLSPGEGEVVVTDPPPGGRTTPQSPGY